MLRRKTSKSGVEPPALRKDAMPLIPNRFLFRVSHPCVHVPGIPDDDDDLFHLPDECRLASLAEMDERRVCATREAGQVAGAVPHEATRAVGRVVLDKSSDVACRLPVAFTVAAAVVLA